MCEASTRACEAGRFVDLASLAASSSDLGQICAPDRNHEHDDADELDRPERTDCEEERHFAETVAAAATYALYRDIKVVSGLDGCEACVTDQFSSRKRDEACEAEALSSRAAE